MKKRVSDVTGVWSDIKIDWKLSVETVYCSKKDGHWRELKWKKTVFKENRLKKANIWSLMKGKVEAIESSACKFSCIYHLYLSLVSAFSALISLFSDHIIASKNNDHPHRLENSIFDFETCYYPLFWKRNMICQFLQFFRGKDILNDVNKICNY